MDHLSSQDVIKKIVNHLMLFWSIFFIPLVIMSILVFTGHGDLAAHNELSWKILYVNLLIFPFIILISTIGSWYLLKKKKYGWSLVLALFPLLNILIETVVLDLILFFAS